MCSDGAILPSNYQFLLWQYLSARRHATAYFAHRKHHWQHFNGEFDLPCQWRTQKSTDAAWCSYSSIEYCAVYPLYPAMGYQRCRAGEHCGTRCLRRWFDSDLQEAHGRLEVPGITYAQEEANRPARTNIAAF